MWPSFTNTHEPTHRAAGVKLVNKSLDVFIFSEKAYVNLSNLLFVQALSLRNKKNKQVICIKVRMFEAAKLDSTR